MPPVKKKGLSFSTEETKKIRNSKVKLSKTKSRFKYEASGKMEDMFLVSMPKQFRGRHHRGVFNKADRFKQKLDFPEEK
jgi:hypothetical protein